MKLKFKKIIIKTKIISMIIKINKNYKMKNNKIKVNKNSKLIYKIFKQIKQESKITKLTTIIYIK